MKIDPSLQPAQRDKAGLRGQAQAAQWLADLERALLDAGRQLADTDAQQAGQSRQGRPPAAMTGDSAGHGLVPRGGEEQARSAPAPSQDMEKRASGSRRTPVAELGPLHDETIAPAATDEAAPSSAALPAEDQLMRQQGSGTVALAGGAEPAPVATLLTSPDSADPLAAGPASLTARRLPPESSSAMPAEEPARADDRDAPVRYSKRLFHLAWGDEVQASIRDTSLAADQRQSVAQALARQLRRDGVPLRRVYVNGQVFEISIPTHPEE